MNQIQFDGILSYDDWDVFLTSFFVGDAEPKEHYIDIPFSHGSLDLTETLTGEVSYGNRDFEAVFTIKPPRSNWPDFLRMARSYLNGKKRVIRILDDPGYYLIGRCKTAFEIDGVVGVLTVTATCEPWKYKNALTTKYVMIGAGGQAVVYLFNAHKNVIPTVTASAPVTVTFDGQTINVPAGTSNVTNMVLAGGENPVIITGTAGTDITITYQEGAL